MSKYDVGFELRLDQLLELTRPKKRRPAKRVIEGRDPLDPARRRRVKHVLWRCARGHSHVSAAAARTCDEQLDRPRYVRAGGKARLARGEQGPRGGRTEVQSLLFPAAQWDLEGARAWATAHGYDAGGLDITEGHIRLRQRKPSREIFRRYRTKTLSKRRGRTIKAVIGVR